MNFLPHRNDLMSPVVEVIKALGGSATNEEIVGKVIEALAIPDALTALAYVTKRGTEDGRTQKWKVLVFLGSEGNARC